MGKLFAGNEGAKTMVWIVSTSPLQIVHFPVDTSGIFFNKKKSLYTNPMPTAMPHSQERNKLITIL